MGMGRLRAPTLAVVATLALVAVACVPAPGLASLGDDARPAHDGPVAQTSPEADAVSLRAELSPDGSAAWQVTYRIELASDNETAAFEDLQAEIVQDPAPYVDRFRDRMVRTATAAENATGREMAIENVSVSATRESLPQGEYGVVTYRLTWQGFAAVDGDRLRAGDAIDQFFLDERTSLTVAWPQAFGLESVRPEPATTDGGSVTWQGRRDFGPGEPRVVVARGASGGAGGGNGGQSGGAPLALLGLGLLAVVVVALGVAWYRRRDDDGQDGGAPAAAERDGAGGGSGANAASEGPPAELLSNEERVLQLLEDNGGRLKQQEVAGRLDWTDAKTSQVVGELRDAQRLESFRLGRENVLTLPDVSLEPDAEDE